LPLWFLRRKKQKTEEQAPPAAAAQPPTSRADPPAEAATQTSSQRRRRRGSRGGRGRKPAGERPEQATAQPQAVPKQEERKDEHKPQRKPARKDERSQRSQRSQRRAPPPRRAPLPAAKRELLVSVDVGEQRVAVLEDDRVAEVYLERPERRSITGNVYKGSVDNVLPGMEAAFVEIGLEKNGFLYVDEIVVPELEGKRHGKKIQDLLSRGQELLVQAVKDPMKGKGARLTTEISLPGRFVVFVPHGEGLGVSRRLEDDERVRLREILKSLELPSGGLIVRTAAEGASAEDIERDVVFLQRLWKSIQARAGELSAPALVYQEAELPLRVVRDLFTTDFERAYVDHERTHKRIVGYLKKTSPHMVERVVRHRDKQPLFEAHGVQSEVESTLSRRVDLPSGGYLIFDYAEAFTVIDVNTGRFTGSRGKGSSNLEDTITKNNLEAVKEVVRQLRLRDIGGIIVIDFIDMANPKNRAHVEDALKKELERDRTKTYVVEISPLGLVEMTRQNVTEGPREILTKKCPTCAGDGIVVSEASAAIDVERRLRALAAKGRSQAFKVELNAEVANTLIGPGAARLVEVEAHAKRRFFLEAKDDVALDHFAVLAQGKTADLMPQGPVSEGAELTLTLGEIGLYDPTAAVGKVDGYSITVAGAAKRVGKKVRVRIERVLGGTAYGVLAGAAAGAGPGPVTAESEAEKPTRRPRTRKAAELPLDEQTAEEPVLEPAEVGEDSEPLAEAPIAEADEVAEPDAGAGDAAEPDAETGDEERPKRKTRRGSRGGRGRKRKPVVGVEGSEAATNGEIEPEAAPVLEAAPTIHLPDPGLGREDGAEPTEDAAAPKRRTRRGTRGGRNRRKKPVATLDTTPEPVEAGAPSASRLD